MTEAPPISGGEPFFLAGPRGPLFAMHYPPAPYGGTPRAVVYVHPLGEEMNVARRQVARQARKLAASGVGVLVLDLYGCGDSGGEFRDARWEGWKDDLAAARQWLVARGTPAPAVWGHRLGALLALDVAADYPAATERVVLWQPAPSGEEFVRQYLFFSILTGGAVDRTAADAPDRHTLAEVRRRLADGDTVEVMGYEFTPELALAIDRVRMAPLGPRVACPIHWVAAVPSPGAPPSAAALRVLEEWARQGVRVCLHRALGQGPRYGHDPFDEDEIDRVMREIFVAGR
jgi:exosortase A-associated hydrolase 2